MNLFQFLSPEYSLRSRDRHFDPPLSLLYPGAADPTCLPLAAPILFFSTCPIWSWGRPLIHSPKPYWPRDLLLLWHAAVPSEGIPCTGKSILLLKYLSISNYKILWFD